MSAARLVWKRVVRMQIQKGKRRRTVLENSDSDHIGHVIETLQKQRFENFVVSGVMIFDQDMTGKDIKSAPVVASTDTVQKSVKQNVIDEVFLAHQGEEPYRADDQLLYQYGCDGTYSIISVRNEHRK